VQDGAGSWTESALRLRDELGPFRLAYLEMLLRIADETASARAEKEAAV
jgi:CRISPR-associated endonuclease/helicase Cas3